MQYKYKDVAEMLKQSNLIEKEPSFEAFEDAMAAWKYMLEVSRTPTTRAILTAHQLLLKRLRPDIAGKFRDCDVWIAGKYKPFISESLIKEEVSSWIKGCLIEKVKKHSQAEREATVKQWHIDFEGIHPFEDGNGRVGRILYNFHRYKLGLPIHIITFENRWDYYDWF